jgi:hypothetical protein
MNAIPAQLDAPLALLVAYAADMYSGPTSTVLTPPADPRYAPDWALRGWLTAVDAIFRSGPLGQGDRVYYGVLLESTCSPGQFVAAVRGTDGILEWLDDAEFSIVTRADGAHVEAGFNGIYETMELIALDGSTRPAADGIAALVRSGSITVVGHSLGGAHATYLALDLARNEHLPVTARLFASPRPGDHTFADLFATWVHDARAYAYGLDIVPKIPIGFGYSPLHCLEVIDHDIAQARIQFALGCFHHVWCYAACLDYKLLPDWYQVPPGDKSLTGCIRGPR